MGATYAFLMWELPTNPGSPQVSFYQLIILEEDDEVLYNVTLPESPQEFNATSLLPATDYTVTIRAVSQFSPIPIIGNFTDFEFITNITGIYYTKYIARNVHACRIKFNVYISLLNVIHVCMLVFTELMKANNCLVM